MYNKNLKGTIYIEELNRNYVKIYGRIDGLNPGKHGFHIHEAGDLREGCKSCCAHYNPTNTTHAGLDGGHAGDLGNIKTDSQGVCNMSIKTDKFIVDEIL